MKNLVFARWSVHLITDENVYGSFKSLEHKLSDDAIFVDVQIVEKTIERFNETQNFGS